MGRNGVPGLNVRPGTRWIWREFDWHATIAASQRALALNPNLDQAHFFTAAAYYHLGHMEEALNERERGQRLQGGDTVEPARIAGLVALFSADFRSATVHLEAVSRRSSRAIGDTYLALAYYYSGDIGRARRMLEQLGSERSVTTVARSRSALAGILAATGDTPGARRLLGALLAHDYRDHHIGTAYAQLGEANDALVWLRTAADTGFPCLPWYERDPLLGPLRKDPRFSMLLDHVKELGGAPAAVTTRRHAPGEAAQHRHGQAATPVS